MHKWLRRAIKIKITIKNRDNRKIVIWPYAYKRQKSKNGREKSDF